MSSYQVNSSNGSSNLEFLHSNQDLIMERRNGRRKKLILISAGAIGIILIAIVIVLLVVFLTKNNDSKPIENSAISLEDVLSGTLTASTSFNATWISGNEVLYRNEKGDILIYNFETFKTETILFGNDSILENAFEYNLSPDRNYLLVGRNFQKLYRHSFLGQYSIIKLSNNKDESQLVNVSGESVLQYASWGPIENSLVFVIKNNIYYKSNVESNNNDYVKITDDGQIGTIYNGVPDWVYEEEVFSSNKALWFSPDGKKLAYVKFDDTNVPLMTIPVYGPPGNVNFLYTRAIQIKYPKAGTNNPRVSLHLVDILNSYQQTTLNIPSSLSNVENILATVGWANNSTITAVWMNRVQNYAEILAYEYTTTNNNNSITTRTISSINETNGWIELFTPPLFSKDGSKMVVILSQKQQQQNVGSYRHLTLFDVKNETDEKIALTNGTFVVIEILSWDSLNNMIYYTANSENDPAVQHVYRVSIDSKIRNCLSCNLKYKNNNKDCLYNTASFGFDQSFYALMCEGPDVPQITVRNTKNDSFLFEWNNNEQLSIKLTTKSLLPISKRITLPLAEGFEAQVLLKLPPNFDDTGATKYPMLVQVYGGPDSYQVTEKYSIDWGSYLASNKSIIYAMIDGRGSGLKGDKMLFTIYRALGTVEIVDQINVTKQLQNNLPYVDSSRTGIWGWSYGGFASTMALAKDKEGIFKCAMSVAPVTDWVLYDSIYTERFMGLPSLNDNYYGYQNASLFTDDKYEGIRNKKYFLIHGTLDDNVHYQQSMFWAKILEQQDILFRQATYPDEDHGLASVRPHLYHSLENFLDECFQTNLS